MLLKVFFKLHRKLGFFVDINWFKTVNSLISMSSNGEKMFNFDLEMISSIKETRIISNF